MIEETAHASLGAWESFCVIVGSSAPALTGLRAEAPPPPRLPQPRQAPAPAAASGDGNR